MRFLGLGLEDGVPEATTLWLYREAPMKTDMVADIFARFDACLRVQGYRSIGGQIIDASIVAAPKQRNTAEGKATIKSSGTPEGWAKKPAKRRQKGTDTRWTQKNGRNRFGYKNHVGIDRKHEFVHGYGVTGAACHDSQKLEGLPDPTNTSADVWADSAYRSSAAEAMLKERGRRRRTHRRGARNHPLNERLHAATATRSQVRVRVEHVFGHQTTAIGGKMLRIIGVARAKAKIGMMNLAYNISRLASLHRLAESPP